MEVILMEKVANLGELGDVVKVKDGFARNFLIPHGKAKRATEANRKAFESRRSELEKAQAEQLAAAKSRGEKLEGLTLQITQKAGPDGRLFGSVTNYDIVEALKKQATRSSARTCACRRDRSSRWARCRSRSRCTPTSPPPSRCRCWASSSVSRRYRKRGRKAPFL